MKAIQIFFKIILIVLFTSSCAKKEESLPINNATLIDRDFYIKEALTKGDTSAYYNLSVYYMDAPVEELLYPALIMANKYGYHLAFADVYKSLTCHDHKMGVSELEDLDTKTRQMAVEYLVKGAEKRDRECQKRLGELYLEGKYLKKDTIKGNQLIKDGDRY